MDTRAEREKVREAVRGLLEADHAAGALKDLAEYKKPFPGFWDLAAEEYEKFVGAMKGTQAAPAPSGDTVHVGGATSPPVAPPPSPPPPKEERIGPYRLVKELGRGGMGVVYLAEDTRIHRKVALKVLSPQFASSTHLQMRFRREAEVASRIDHPNICAVYDADVEGEVPYIAMRYVEGKTLQEWIAVSKSPTGEMPPGAAPHTVTRLPTSGKEGPAPAPRPRDPKEAAKSSGIRKRDEIVRVIHLMEKAARALHVAHEAGLIHRDIKPGNIMVTAEGEPVLLDFGLARADDEESHQLTQTGSLMGTPAYMSPEQLTAQRIKLDRRTDVYSLGATLYECLTLKLPFEAPTLEALYQKILATDPDNARKLNPAIPDDLRVVLETALEKDRDRRYQTSLGLAEDLRRIREHEPILARPAGLILRLRRWTQRNRALSAVILLIVVGLASTTWQWNRTRLALRRARALGLVSASSSAQVSDPMLALLLAREAMRAEPVPASETRLRECLDLVDSTGSGRKEGVGFRVRTLHPGVGSIQSICFSTDGGKLLVAGKDDVEEWTLAGERRLSLHLETAPSRAPGDPWNSPNRVFGCTVAYLPTTELFLVTPGDNSIQAFDTSGNRAWALHHDIAVYGAVPSPLGLSLVTESYESFQLWDLRKRGLQDPVWVAHDVPSPQGACRVGG